MSRGSLAPAQASGVRAAWAQHDQERLDWAFRAYTRFAESLSPEIRDRLASKDQQAEAYVVVFGKTQVGKTTLLMELMGVLATQMPRVARVLRGGRAAGQSATATTMEYRRSPDQRWGLKVNETAIAWYGDDLTMEAELGRLRTAMEMRQLVAHGPCVVFVPLACFDADVAQSGVRMLDLPGDKPANAAEQEHVHAMARKYVPLADLILLVGRGDDLSFLQGGGLTLPGIEDWQSAPRRFRIVTTYSFTAQSVRDMVREHAGEAEVPLYRRRLVEQIERSIPLSEDVKRAANFFPLEFGQSWLDAREAEPLLYARVQPMMLTLKQQLLSDIQASTTPLARLRVAVDAHMVIARVKKKRQEVLGAESEALQAVLGRAQHEQGQAQLAAENIGKQCASLAQAQEALTDEALSKDIARHFVFATTAPGDPYESVDGFKAVIRRAKSSMKQAMLASHPDTARMSGTQPFWRRVELKDGASGSDDILDDAFSSFLSTLNAYWVDKYWSTGEGSDYARDLRTFKRCIDEVQTELKALARKRWLAAAHAWRERLLEELEEQRYKRDDFQRLADGGIAPIKLLEEKLAQHTQARELFEQRMENDLVESRRFASLLDAEYVAELEQRRQAICTAGNRVTGFLGLLAAVRLVDVRKQVLLHIEPSAI